MGDEKQKNQAMVNAFGTGKPPVATVRKQGETKQQQRARGQGIDPNSDISAIFSGMQQMRTKVHKGLSGMPLNPDGTDPGNSFDRFMRQNPHLQGAAQRQAQFDQQRQEQFQQKYPNASGYPALFPGKSSPPGEGQDDIVGSPNPSGEPGGETIMGRMPNVQGEGMLMRAPAPRRPGVQFGPSGGQINPAAMNALGVPNVPGIQYGARKPVEQSGWDALFPGKQASMAPNDGPQVPPISPQQLEALKALDTRGYPAKAAKELPQAPGRFQMGLTNYFPGNDYDYLQQLFPGQSIDQILQMFPAYANQFR